MTLVQETKNQVGKNYQENVTRPRASAGLVKYFIQPKHGQKIFQVKVFQ